MCFRDARSRSGATRGVLSDFELEKASGFWQGPSGGMLGPGVHVDGASRRRSLDNAVTPFLLCSVMDIGWKRQKRNLILGKLWRKARLEPGNGYTKGSPNIDATLLDWSGRGWLAGKGGAGY